VRHPLFSSLDRLQVFLREDRAMSSQAANSYEYDVDVAPDDIDEMGHVNNAVYLKWVQAAVIRHWRRFAPKEAAASHLWVALKHEISYLHPAFLNDHVVVRVVLQKLLGARAFYKTMIKHGDDVLAEVESCWCCLDSVTRKPVRLTRDIVARFLPPEAPQNF
jgi:acyl-CoA thioester hydrolase